VVQHTGSWGGFRTVLYRLPDIRKTLVILANTPDFLNGPKFFALIDLMIPVEKGTQEPESTASTTADKVVKLSTKQLQKYTGLFAVKGQPHLRYKSAVKNDTLTITQLWDELSYQLVPTSNNAFFRKDFTIVQFEFDKKSGVPVIHERLEVLQTEKVSAYHSKTNLEEYTGEYHSLEVGVSYHIAVEDKKLVIYRKNEKIKTLSPVSKDVFGNKIQGYQFLREAGKISGFLIQDRRVRNLQFLKTSE